MQATRLTLPKTDILSKKMKKENSSISPSKFRSNDYTTLKAHKDRAKYQILDQVKKNQEDNQRVFLKKLEEITKRRIKKDEEA